MAQAAGNVNIVPKNHVFFNKKGVWTAGDGATAHDVYPREAIAASLAGSLVSGSDVLMDESDFKKLVAPATEPTNDPDTTSGVTP